ncbi:SDR family NAD(P)-dependent oxidoreductase [Iamia sp. SCSIO 61187]|uniref:SDR family NAD(P)-dependent oxidoreductase n=1 Tax=Iamia sp. SCSIO 61187 TaxID=2722752 RepID=UPI001C6371A0|nr:SDR family NAD(P)-dependent oxidoreductase [Iamia sp. SCSIO 61187]QYG95120.1 SDR family NAD(P)-dependent oxidoreductase [Iamia sp. SCSIO 61187]
MDSFDGRLAVVTGGGTGMGRELVVQLAAAGASVAACDVNLETLDETAELARKGAPDTVRITTHQCDVADPAAMDRFRDEVLAQHETDHVHLVFNNAGIGGGGSFLNATREEWERTFGVCWGGVYNGCRSFLPLLVAAPEGHLVNTSSVNGFWASLGPGVPHTAYSSAKFAVKGLSEALLEDLRLHAPHVSVSVVMPGHIGTDIVLNSGQIHGADGDPAERAGAIREAMAQRGVPSDGMDDEAVLGLVTAMGEAFRDNAPMTAAEAATVILDGVRAGEWRILVGEDAKLLDERVRADPLGVYGPDAGGLDTIVLGA